jgi:uncharacterized protein YkwD
LHKLLTSVSAALVAAAVLAPGASAGVPCQAAQASSADAGPRALAVATVCLINVERRARGLRPLRINFRLSRAAFDKTEDMVRRHYFAHGPAPLKRQIAPTGYLDGSSSWALGENLAWGWGRHSSPRLVLEQWLASPSHRANVLGRGFRDIGVAVFEVLPSGDPGATYTAEFGRR